MKTSLIAAAALAVLTLPASSAFAESEPASTIRQSETERQNSVNVSPLGLLFGTYAVNYERMVQGGHGFLVEGAYSRVSNSDSSSASAGGAVGYRWHWRGKQNSGFLGATLAYSAGTGEATVSSGAMSEDFDLDVTALTATANIGKRWAWDSGLNITLRFGLGYGDYNVTTDSTDPDAQEAVELANDLLELLPVAIDGELSVGYNF